ncbi:MAG: hypothetical protein B7X28_00975 [Halothiobacillus sp. 13-55-253]|nr:MAG: hypothetical protein B7X28_00975 [Halothiobacillus sp. 13-55-253]
MNPLSLIALLPVIEIILLIGMGSLFGFWFTLLWIIGTAAVGVYLLRRVRGSLGFGSCPSLVEEIDVWYLDGKEPAHDRNEAKCTWSGL